jgi:hypothetical protein
MMDAGEERPVSTSRQIRLELRQTHENEGEKGLGVTTRSS